MICITKCEKKFDHRLGGAMAPCGPPWIRHWGIVIIEHGCREIGSTSYITAEFFTHYFPNLAPQFPRSGLLTRKVRSIAPSNALTNPPGEGVGRLQFTTAHQLVFSSEQKFNFWGDKIRIGSHIWAFKR